MLWLVNEASELMTDYILRMVQNDVNMALIEPGQKERYRNFIGITI